MCEMEEVGLDCTSKMVDWFKMEICALCQWMYVSLSSFTLCKYLWSDLKFNLSLFLLSLLCTLWVLFCFLGRKFYDLIYAMLIWVFLRNVHLCVDSFRSLICPSFSSLTGGFFFVMQQELFCFDLLPSTVGSSCMRLLQLRRLAVFFLE